MFFMARLFNGQSRGPYYPSLRHRDMIEKICRNLNVTALFGRELIEYVVACDPSRGY